ncbi:hypothetical protein [Marinactinospora rubrisoli]|uniref:LPXTG cell wall anchor domain-containing protein n=1 Tax=Marinactinospora rubrisoli TaxID=2715399 RepID=A0ABW2KMU0_9ACTN
MVSALDLMHLLFGDAAAEIVPWLWGGLGVLVGAGAAVAVIRRQRQRQ